MQKEVRGALRSLLDYILGEGFEGYDPYDGLNSYIIRKLKNKWIWVATTVFFRLSPINLRKLFRIKKDVNPKAMGLLLSAYSSIYHSGLMVSFDEIETVFKWLCQNSSVGYSGFCWGYNFPWQDRIRFLEKNIPTVVNTAFVGHGILDYHDETKDNKALEIARSACDFILEDLNILEDDHGMCFSYTPKDRRFVHNANVLGGSLLARVYSHTGENILLEKAIKSFDFTLHHQYENGLWAYNFKPESGKERFQIDWHQGFILDSLIWFLRFIRPSEDRYLNALRLGAEFYKTQFLEKGACYWRYPRKWPIDIHNQAQGVITFSKLEEFIPGSIKRAERIARWTLVNLRDKKAGFFYYEKWPFFTNKISYFRWGQVWMLLALATLLAEENKFHNI